MLFVCIYFLFVYAIVLGIGYSFHDFVLFYTRLVLPNMGRCYTRYVLSLEEILVYTRLVLPKMGRCYTRYVLSLKEILVYTRLVLPKFVLLWLDMAPKLMHHNTTPQVHASCKR